MPDCPLSPPETRHVPDRRDSEDWSIRARPECRAPSYKARLPFAAPDASARAVLGIVSDFQRLLHGLKVVTAEHRAKISS